MYERFTDLARSVIKSAREEAERLDCTRLGTEHVLLALLQQEGGAAAQILTNLNVDRPKLRMEIEQHAPGGSQGNPEGNSSQSPDLSNVVESAMEEARTLGHSYVGTEHLLLGLFHGPEDFVTSSLNATGVTVENVRSEVRKLIGQGFDGRTDENMS